MGWKKDLSHAAYRCYLKVLLWGPWEIQDRSHRGVAERRAFGSWDSAGIMRIAKGKRDTGERDRASRQTSHGELGERTDVKCGI